MRFRFLQIALLAIAVAMLATAALSPHFRFAFIMVAMVALLLLATSIHAATDLSRSVRDFRDRTVRVVVWGRPVSQSDTTACRIESVRVLGPGLHLFLRCADEARGHLKIAQPRESRITDRSIEIRVAAYVQWNGRKLPRALDVPAVTLTVGDDCHATS